MVAELVTLAVDVLTRIAVLLTKAFADTLAELNNIRPAVAVAVAVPDTEAEQS